LPQLLPLAWFVPVLAVCLLRFPGRTLVVALALSAAWTTFLAEQQMAQRLPAAAHGEIRWLHGHVSGLPEVSAYRTRFAFASDTAPQHLRLSWYGDAPELHLGDCYELQVKLSAPHGSANPGGFDYEAWLWRQGIGATGYIKAARACAATRAMPIGRLRERVVAAIATALDAHPMRGIIEALTVGVTMRISDAQWQVFRHTGTSHIVAISGWHIGLVAGWLLFIGRWLLLRLPRPVPALPLAALAALIGAGAYAMLAGLALPTLRALVMLAVALAALLYTRTISFSRILALAALVVVLWHPVAVLAPGFWLSFGAVAWIVYLVRVRPRGRRSLFLWLQFGLALGLAPLTLYLFSQASLVSPLVNALILPLAGLFLPLLLLSVLLLLLWPALGTPLLQYGADVLAAGWSLLAHMAAWPLAAIAQSAPGLLAVALALLGVALLFAPRGLPGRWLGAILLLPLLLSWRPPGQTIPAGGYQLVVLDVGQGLAAVVQTRNHVLVYDTGPAYRTGFNAGSAIVVPYLRQARLKTVDRLLVSHGHNDHIGGAAALQQLVPVRHYSGAGGTRPCQSGQSWHWDGVDFEILHPLEPNPDLSENNGSCVLRVSGPGGVTLLAGDIEREVEQALVQRAATALAADIVVVPHHGSATSSTAAFVAATAPAYALIPSGWHNRWDFPAAEVVARYREQGAQVFATADSGALIAPVWPQAPIVVQRWRVLRPRLWQIPDPN